MYTSDHCLEQLRNNKRNTEKKRLQNKEPQQIIYQLKARDECKKKKRKRTHLHEEKRR